MDDNRSDQNSNLTPASDLGFDIVHGVNLEDMTQPLILYWNRRDAVRGLNRQSRWLSLFTLVLFAIPFVPAIWGSHVFTKSADAILFVFVVIYIFLVDWGISMLARRDFTESLDPIIEIREEGLTIRCPTRHFENIPWDEIKEIYAFIYIWRFVGIVPRDLEKTLKHSRKDRSRLGRILAAFMMGTKNTARLNRVTQPLCSIFGIQSPAIQIPSQWLPLTADEIVEIMNARRTHALRLQSDGITKLESG